MALENKLGITDSATLARTEEKLSKEKAVKLFEYGILDNQKAGSFSGSRRDTQISFLRISMISQGK